jgi:hypothetical protein
MPGAGRPGALVDAHCSRGEVTPSRTWLVIPSVSEGSGGVGGAQQ